MHPPPEEMLPTDFGKYRLVRRIATGGMAEIFLAHTHASPLEPLVIKRILPHLAKSAEFVSMFLDEARIAAQLKHEAIVRIDDVGQIDGSYYIAMEYVHGEDIRRIYNRAYKLQRSLPLSHSIRVIADAALGLAYAHRLTDLAGRPMGVVHRDVSPQNILVTYDGGVKVVDFGIAKAANKVNQTRAGVLKGKYSYMSPEQALGDAIDHRTDIFALGIILYETTTGTRLFKRNTELATLQAIIKCEVVPPNEALPGYPALLEAILLKALARRPENRHADGKIFSEALYGFLRESGLFVERVKIAEFMRDLFSERLEEERGSGEPALPKEQEVRAEMGDADGGQDGPTPLQDTSPSVPSHGVTNPFEPGDPTGNADTKLRPRDRDWPDSGATPNQRSERLPGFAAKASEALLGNGAGPARPLAEVRLRRKPTDVIGSAPGNARQASLSPDALPTVFAQEAYRGPRPGGRGGFEGHEGGTGFERRSAEETERVRAREQPRARMGVPRTPRLKGGLLLFLSGLAIATFAVWLALRWWGLGKITIHTEPGASVSVGQRRLGEASPDGTLGPFELKAGTHILRVSKKELGFERERALEVRRGAIHEFEIRGRQGELRLAVAPWARVRIDGKDVGVTPLPSVPLYEGAHEVELENPDLGRHIKTTVRISAGRVEELKIDLATSGEPL